MLRILALLLLCPTVQSLFAQHGALDPAFGNNGLVLTAHPAGHYAVGTDIVLQPDGKILVSGIVIDSMDRMALFRYMPDGSLDPSFGNNGIAIVSGQPYGTVGIRLALQPDGKIVVAGQGILSATLMDDMIIARFDANGSLDPSFATNGIAIINIWGERELPLGLALQPDGQILIAGYAIDSSFNSRPFVMRLKTNGSPDPGFGNGGLVTPDLNTPLSWASDLVLLDGGKILVGLVYIDTKPSENVEDNLLLRLLPDGTLDSTFGDKGMARYDFGDNERLTTMAIQADGKILATGEYYTGITQFALFRYLPDGSVDFNFGDSGRVVTTFKDHSTTGSVALQADGKILLAGAAYSQGSDLIRTEDFGVARLLPDGSLDETFGDQGKLTTNFGHQLSDLTSRMVIQPDHKILLAGYSVGDSITQVAIARYLSNYDPPPVDPNAPETPVRLYPNPTAGEAMLEFQLDAETVVWLDLYDISGRLIRHLWNPATHPAGAYKIPVVLDATVPAGAYFLRFYRNDMRMILPVVKQ